MTCDRCGTKGRRTKQVTVTTWPRFLVLHVRRWRISGEPPHVQTRKDGRHLAFPTELQCLPCAYGLRAVIDHAGRTHGHGHYTCCANDRFGNWRDCSDSVSKPVEGFLALCKSAYLLFYEQKIDGLA